MARVALDGESFQRVVDWLDTNAMFYDDYSWNKPQWRRVSPEGEKALRRHIRETLGAAMAEEPLAALVNLAQPAESRVLKAALSTAAGGWNQADGWPTRAHPSYQALLRLVEESIEPLEFADVCDTCAREECLCDTCWVRLARQRAKK